MGNGIKVFVASVVVVVGLLIYGIGGMTHVGIGNVGIEKHMSGEITKVPQGFHWVGWGVTVQDYPTYRQALGGKKGVKLTVGTSDQQELPVVVNLNWNIDTSKSKELYQSVGGNDIEYVSDTIVLPTMKNDINKITHTFGWNDIKGSEQAEVTKQIEKMLKEDLSKSGIELVNFGFSHVGSPAGMAQSQQQLATSELEVKKEQAKQNAAKIANQTKIMNAEAEAKANEIISKSLTPNIIQQQMIKRWDGKLPQVQGSSATPLLNLK